MKCNSNLNLSPDTLAAHIRFQSVFCLTGSVTNNSDIKSRETEVHQSSQVEYSLSPAEQCVRQHREQQSEINSAA